MKKICFFLMVFSLSISVCNALEISSKSAILMDYETGEILYSYNENEALAPASMTKIMSMLLVMEAIDDGLISYDTEVTISENAASMGGSQVYLNAGEVYTVHELLKAVAVASGNDAVVALAEKVAGSVEEFVKLMNEKANALGLTNTVFKNPHGLDEEGHTSSAYDMAIMARELIKHEKILEYTSIYEDYLEKSDGTSTWLVNTNKLVRFYDGVDGLKTGFTSSAGYCLTATAKKDNLRLIAIVMGADSSSTRNSEVSSLLNYGFNTYQMYVLYSNTNPLGTKRVENGKTENVEIVLKDSYQVLLKQTDEIPSYSYNVYTDTLVAPITKGSIIGYVEVVDNDGNVVDKLDVTVLESVEKSSFLELWLRNIKTITGGKVLIK